MDGVAADGGAFCEAAAFLRHFNDLPDPRQRGKVVYPLDEVLLLALLAVLAGAETFVDIARFGDRKLDMLRRFRPFHDGTPSHDHLDDIFAILDAEQFQRCFVSWVAALTGAPAEVIAIDGKTSRRSYQKKGAKAPIHMVSAFAARQRLVLGQVKVAEKSNEIVAIPRLLDMMAIEGAIVTIDAIGCQRDIAQKIVDKKADYVLALKSLPPRRRGAIKARCARMSNSSSRSRRPGASRTQRLARIRRSMAITAASRPEPSPSSTTSAGCSTATPGPA
jgi:predicted transposase YbfD/YdcC